MLRVLLSVLALPVMAWATPAKNTVNITGKVVNMEEEYVKVYMLYTYNGKKALDSSRITEGTYHFNLEVEGAVLVHLLAQIDRTKIKGPVMVNNRARMQVYIQPGDIEITSTDYFSNIQVHGSPAQDTYLQLTRAAEPYRKDMDLLRNDYYALNRSDDSAAAKKVLAKIDAVIEKRGDKVYANFVRKHPDDPMALFALQMISDGNEKLMQTAMSLFKTLPKAVQESPEGHELIGRLEGKKRIAIGMMAPDFTQNDTAGNPVKLSDFRGKYVLLDFWASWCGPCRKENPHVVKYYHQYKDKGFTVLGVSLDKNGDKARWIKAIQDDQLDWTHVSDLKYWGNEAALLYGVSGIPQNYLIDPKGRIIASNLRGEALGAKLAAILDK